MSHRKRSIPEDLGLRPDAKKRFSPAIEGRLVSFKRDDGDDGPEQNVEPAALPTVSTISILTLNASHPSLSCHTTEGIANASSSVNSGFGKNHESIERLVCYGVVSSSCSVKFLLAYLNASFWTAG